MSDKTRASAQPLTPEEQAKFRRLLENHWTRSRKGSIDVSVSYAERLLATIDAARERIGESERCGEPSCHNTVSHRFCVNHWHGLHTGDNRYGIAIEAAFEREK